MNPSDSRAKADSIAVLVASYNRRELTLRALARLSSQTGLPGGPALHVHLVDSSSPDGTADAVRFSYPATDITTVPADTYWGGAMAVAGERAGTEHDYHLWLNDDVDLYPDALRIVLELAQERPGAIIVGYTVDCAGRRSYGGLKKKSFPWQMAPLATNELRCDTMNGNFVLVPRSALSALGNVDPTFPHAMGDIDYGFRARKAGIEIFQAPAPVGVCEQNPAPSMAGSSIERVRKVMQVKRLPPRPWWTLWRRHAGILAPLIFMKPYLSAAVRRGRSSERVPPRRPLRVLQVMNELQYSGAEMQLLDDLSDDRVISQILATGSHEGPLAQHFRARGADVVHCPFNARLSWLAKLRTAAVGCDVVNVHVERASFWVCLTFRVAGKRVIRTVHNNFQFTGLLRTRRALQRMVLQVIGVRFVAVGLGVQENERLRFGVSSTVVPNSFDPRFESTSQKTRHAGGEATVVSVGNCVPQKNHAALLTCLRRMAADIRELKYIHIGNTALIELEEQSELENAKRELSVEMVGTVDPLPYFTQATVFVMPSLWEGSSVAVLEAMAAGVPVVLTDTPGLREHKACSAVTWADDCTPEGIELAVRSVVEASASQWQELSKSITKYACDNFSSSARRDAMLRIYESSAGVSH